MAVAMADIFISYARRDAELVGRLVSAFKEERLEHWFDGNTLGGQRFDSVIRARLAEAKAVVVVWSRASVDSDFVKGEARDGLRRNIAVPILIGGITEVDPPHDFHAVHAIVFSNWAGGRREACFVKLVQSLERLGVRPTTALPGDGGGEKRGFESGSAVSTAIAAEPSAMSPKSRPRWAALLAGGLTVLALALVGTSMHSIHEGSLIGRIAEFFTAKPAAENDVDRWEASHAENHVHLPNGNFTVSYTDAFVGDVVVSRAYNSQNDRKGAFGWGWGLFGLEAQLEVLGDGFIVIAEVGGSREQRMRPVNGKLSVAESIDDILAAARRLGDARASEAAYRERLRGDADFRQSEWRNFQSKGLLPVPARPSVGTRFESELSGSLTAIVKPQGYTFENSSSGTRIEFDLEGLPVEIAQPGRTVRVTRLNAGRTIRVEDLSKRHLTLSTNAKGLVERIEVDNRTATYRYNEKDELVFSTDVDANRYEYAYSEDGKHNLTEIKYSDGTSMALSYHGSEQGNRVKSVKRPDGTYSEFKYGEPSEVGPITVRRIDLKVRGPTEVELFKGWLELHQRNDVVGKPVLEKTITHINGDRIEREFDRRVQMAALVKRNGQPTRYKFDAAGRPTQRDAPNSTLFIDYAAKAPHVSRLQHRDNTSAGAPMSSWSFDYDDQGRLATASNAEFESFDFDYSGVRLSTINARASGIKVSISDEGGASRITYGISYPGVNQTVTAETDREGSVTAAAGAVNRQAAQTLGRMAADLVALSQLLQRLMDEVRDPCSCNVPDLAKAFLTSGQVRSLQNLERALRGPTGPPR
jgi:YD repeat-containing protein